MTADTTSRRLRTPILSKIAFRWSWTVYSLMPSSRPAPTARVRPGSSRVRSGPTSPTRVAVLYEDEIVALRKELTDAGFDAGAATIAAHMAWRHKRPLWFADDESSNL
jgi:hypothetical protein